MSNPVYNVLFLCTGNSARSILAEAVMNGLPICEGRYAAFSAGSQPKSHPNPLALELLERSGFPIGDLRSKSWDEFARPDAPKMDFIFTVCDAAAGEACPYWPGHPVTAHWGMPDPAAVEGTGDERRKAFHDTLLIVRRRIERFAGLPVDDLDHHALRRLAGEIGSQ